MVSSPQEARRLLPLGIALFVAGPFAFVPVFETDAGWHLALGRLITSSGIPFRNALSWTEPDTRWYATSWLFDWLAFRATNAAGVLGLQLVTFFFFALTLFFLYLTVRQARSSRGEWMVLVVALLLVPRLTPRPHLASWALLAATLALAFWASPNAWRRRAACIPLVALGSNFHSGAVFSAALLTLLCLEAALKEGRYFREGFVSLGAWLALLANPGGTFNLLYAFQHLGVYDLVTLSEFRTPSPWDLPAFYAFLPLAVAMAAAQWRSRPLLVVLVGLFAAGGLFAARLAFKFFLVAAPAILGGVPRLRDRFGPRAEGWLLALLVAMALSPNLGRLQRLSIRADFDERELPVRVASFIAEEKLDGPHFNSFGDGGYLEWALPHLPAFLDARVQAYSPAFFRELLAAEREPSRFQAYLRQRGVEWAVTSSTPGRLTGNGLLFSPDWALVYWDDLNDLYVRRDVARLAPLVERSEYRYFRPDRTLGELVLGLATLPREEVLSAEREVQRFGRTSPSNLYAAVVGCGAEVRLGRTDPSVCRQARELVGQNETRLELDKALGLPPLPAPPSVGPPE